MYSVHVRNTFYTYEYATSIRKCLREFWHSKQVVCCAHVAAVWRWIDAALHITYQQSTSKCIRTNTKMMNTYIPPRYARMQACMQMLCCDDVLSESKSEQIPNRNSSFWFFACEFIGVRNCTCVHTSVLVSTSCLNWSFSSGIWLW